MPDREITSLAQQIVAAGFAYAGPNTGNEKQWRERAQEGVIRAAAAMTGKLAWDAMDMLEAHVFAGTYNGYDYEETSTRLSVKIASDTGRDKDKDADGNERIRTDRTDTSIGARMRERLDRVPVGSRILVWKILEQKRDDDNKVRILKHFELLQLNKNSTPPTAPSAASTAAGAPVNPSGAPAAQSPPDGWDDVMERVAALDIKTRVAFVNTCRAEHLVWQNPPIEQVDRIIKHLVDAERK